MSDHELLLAISNMLDAKLKAELQALKGELHDEIQTVRTELLGEIQAVRTELHEEVRTVRAEVQELRAEVQGLRVEVQEVKAELQEVKAEQKILKEELHRIKLYQENVIMPRLNTIEACYTGTYRRYASYVEKMEAIFRDVEMLKIVVAEHSEKLQKLA